MRTVPFKIAALPFLLVTSMVVSEETEPPASSDPRPPEPSTTAEVLTASQPSDWRKLDAGRSLYLKFEQGTVVIELAPEFAPAHVDNILTLVRERYFDGLALVRSQDNYVAQWGDPQPSDGSPRSLGSALETLPAELDRSASGLAFTPLEDPDAYAPKTGFASGFPVGHDPATGRTWLIHCYGMVGVGRDNDSSSGNGSSLYAVIGHAPRHLDRNITLIGRVVAGMEILSRFPRGSGSLGFYEGDQTMPIIESVRLGTEIPAGDRLQREFLDTSTPLFESYIASRRHRREPWFLHSVDRVEVCNVPLATRPYEATGSD